jgi:hypothetical protein
MTPFAAARDVPSDGRAKKVRRTDFSRGPDHLGADRRRT